MPDTHDAIIFGLAAELGLYCKPIENHTKLQRTIPWDYEWGTNQLLMIALAQTNTALEAPPNREFSFVVRIRNGHIQIQDPDISFDLSDPNLLYYLSTIVANAPELLHVLDNGETGSLERYMQMVHDKVSSIHR